MVRRLFGKFGALRETFWFIPALMTLASIVLSAFTLALDSEIDWTGFGSGPLSTAGSAEGARTVLATIAGSMITVASLTFTITIASLSLASSQFGPRLVRNFIRDRGNQVVLGTFIATFTYCLLILRTVRGEESAFAVPSISLTTGVILAMASIGVLIYFINHIAMSIQATRIIATIGRDLTSAIESLYPDRRGGDEDGHESEDAWSPIGEPRSIYSKGSGYIQAIDFAELIESTEKAGIVLRLPHPTGQFIAKGATLGEVFGETRGSEVELDDAVRQSISLGGERAPGRDIEFFIDQLVEIAVRALSPGINDPFTAMEALDQMGASLRQLVGRQLPSPYHRDEQGNVRVVAEAQTFEGALDAAFNAIRQYGAGSVPVMLRLMETIAVLAESAHSSRHKEALLTHARLVERATKERLRESVDIDALETRFESVIEALESHQTPNEVAS